MSDIVDHDNIPLFTDQFDHKTLDANGISIDVISTNGNLWLSAPPVMEAMGMIANGKGDHSRRLGRIDHPDIIRVSDTPFRFADGRRNRGSFISPRAVLKFAEGGTQGFNPFKALPFVEWMEQELLKDGDAETWSPARKQSVVIEPVFHKIEKVKDQSEAGQALDPLRPVGLYLPMQRRRPLSAHELEFCLCPKHWEGLGKCWCGGKGGLRGAFAASFEPYMGDEVLDEDDDFSIQTAWSRTAA